MIICKGGNCPLRKFCLRFHKHENKPGGKYFVVPPYSNNDGESNNCKEFVEHG